VRYRVLDLPVVGRGAFTPLPTTNPRASSEGLVKVSAELGLVPVPVAAKQNGIPSFSLDKMTVGTNVVPDVILPDCYIPYANNMGPAQHIGMAARRKTPLPVPAKSGLFSPGIGFRAKAVGGRKTVAWPRAFQRWPTQRKG
jgi:hypothetical protein